MAAATTNLLRYEESSALMLLTLALVFGVVSAKLGGAAGAATALGHTVLIMLVSLVIAELTASAVAPECSDSSSNNLLASG